jgi:hypothetical protein
LHAALRGELDGLSDEARHVLHVAAVAADPFDPVTVAEIAELDLDNTLIRLDELVAGDLVRVDTDPRPFRFRHPTVRTVA